MSGVDAAWIERKQAEAEAERLEDPPVSPRKRGDGDCKQTRATAIGAGDVANCRLCGAAIRDGEMRRSVDIVDAGRPIAATIDDVCESCCRTMGWPMGYAP